MPKKNMTFASDYLATLVKLLLKNPEKTEFSADLMQFLS